MKVWGVSTVTMVLVAIAASTLTAVSQPAVSPFSHVLPSTPEEIAYREGLDLIMKGGEHYQPLKILADVSGVDRPPLMETTALNIPDSTPVVGILVNEEACAFVLDTLVPVHQHIVNLIMKDKSISVTYCDLVDCVRVLKKDSNSLNPLRVGGLDVDNQLVFLLNGVRYGQASAALPLDDYPFSRTSFGEWRDMYPSTRVYLGPKDSDRATVFLPFLGGSDGST